MSNQLNLEEKRATVGYIARIFSHNAKYFAHPLKVYDGQMVKAIEREKQGKQIAMRHCLDVANSQLQFTIRDFKWFSKYLTAEIATLENAVVRLQKNSGGIVTLFRAPCLMEDEGRHFHEGTFSTWEDAKEMLDELSDSNEGYFRYCNYYYVSDVVVPDWWPNECVKGETP